MPAYGRDMSLPCGQPHQDPPPPAGRFEAGPYVRALPGHRPWAGWKSPLRQATPFTAGTRQRAPTSGRLDVKGHQSDGAVHAYLPFYYSQYAKGFSRQLARVKHTGKVGGGSYPVAQGGGQRVGDRC